MNNQLIIIPTYNEIENIEAILRTVLAIKELPELHVLVVDDNSPDGTGAKVQDIEPDFPGRVHLLSRKGGKQGLASAYIAGFHWTLAHDYEWIVEMDADFSHDPGVLPTFFQLAKSFDFVVGSRYVAGGGTKNWSLKRKIISRGGSLYARTVLGLRIKDVTGGFNLWSRKILQKFDFERFVSRGYAFQIEMKYRATRLGFKGCETPIVFPDRLKGTSKMSGSIFKEGILVVLLLRFVTIPWREIITYLCVGLGGMVTNLLIFTILADFSKFNHNVAAVIGFCVAVVQNYLLNHKLTFKERTTGTKPSLPKLVQFVTVALIGLGINLLTLNLLLQHFNLPFKAIAQIFAIGVATAFNYIGAKFLVFGKKRS